MPIYIALLRGINVGGHKKVPMADLRKLLSKNGFKNVQTYIQSGNVIFESSEVSTVLEVKIKQIIFSHFAFEVQVIVKSRDELLRIFDMCPFVHEKKVNSYFVMLNSAPETKFIDSVKDIEFDNEEVIIIHDALYFYSSVGYGNSKFNMATYERKLKVSGTSRNYKTMVKLLSLSADIN